MKNLEQLCKEYNDAMQHHEACEYLYVQGKITLEQANEAREARRLAYVALLSY